MTFTIYVGFQRMIKIFILDVQINQVNLNNKSTEGNTLFSFDVYIIYLHLIGDMFYYGNFFFLKVNWTGLTLGPNEFGSLAWFKGQTGCLAHNGCWIRVINDHRVLTPLISLCVIQWPMSPANVSVWWLLITLIQRSSRVKHLVWLLRQLSDLETAPNRVKPKKLNWKWVFFVFVFWVGGFISILTPLIILNPPYCI